MNSHQKSRKTDINSLERRHALFTIAGLLGLSVTLDTLAMTESSQQQGRGFLNEDQLNLTAALAEAIIPATDTPGAIAVGAPAYISHHLKVCASSNRQRQFIEGLRVIDQHATQRFGTSFVWIANQEKNVLLHDLEKMQMGFTRADKDFFVFLKSLTLLAYYTSEIGATQELAYLAVPGGYKGSFPFAAVGRAWAT